jgi:trigger factor
MKIVVKDLRERDAFGRQLAVEVPAEEIDGQIVAAVDDLRRGLALPGFRKGKVPRSLVESRFGHEVRSEVIRRTVEEATWQAVRESDLRPIAEPEVEGIDYGDGGSLSFTARVDVRPMVELPEPAGVRVDKTVYAIEPAEIDEILAHLRESKVQLEVVDRPAAMGDVVMIDVTELGAGQVPLIGRRREGIRIELVAERLPPSWLEALAGKRPGDSVVVAVPVKEDELPPPAAPRYHRLDLRQVESKNLPPLDDAFAQQVTPELKTLDELKARIRERLEADEERRAQQTLERDVLDRLAAGIRFEIPDRIVVPMADRMFARAVEALPDLDAGGRERLAVESRRAAAIEVRRELVIAAVAQAQGIAVSDDEARAELRRVERIERRARLQEGAGELAESASGSEGASRLERVRDSLVERKVLKYLVDTADVQVVQGSSKRKRIVTPYDP